MLEVSAVGYKTVKRNVSLKKGRTLEEDFEIEGRLGGARRGGYFG